MSAAVDVLKRELEQQQEKLKAVIEQNRATIDAGKRAEQEVARQRMRVEDITQAIETLERTEKAKMQMETVAA